MPEPRAAYERLLFLAVVTRLVAVTHLGTTSHPQRRGRSSMTAVRPGGQVLLAHSAFCLASSHCNRATIPTTNRSHKAVTSIDPGWPPSLTVSIVGRVGLVITSTLRPLPSAGTASPQYAAEPSSTATRRRIAMHTSRREAPYVPCPWLLDSSLHAFLPQLPIIRQRYTIPLVAALDDPRLQNHSTQLPSHGSPRPGVKRRSALGLPR